MAIMNTEGKSQHPRFAMLFLGIPGSEGVTCNFQRWLLVMDMGKRAGGMQPGEEVSGTQRDSGSTREWKLLGGERMQSGRGNQRRLTKQKLKAILQVPLRAGGCGAEGAREGVLEVPLSWQPGEHLYRKCPGYMLRQAQARSAHGLWPVLGRVCGECQEGNLEGWSQAEHKHCTELQGQLESTEIKAVEKGCGHPGNSGEAQEGSGPLGY